LIEAGNQGLKKEKGERNNKAYEREIHKSLSAFKK